jgi:hypothetical protein
VSFHNAKRVSAAMLVPLVARPVMVPGPRQSALHPREVNRRRQ